MDHLWENPFDLTWMTLLFMAASPFLFREFHEGQPHLSQLGPRDPNEALLNILKKPTVSE